MVAPDRLSRSIDDILPAEETRLRDPFSLTSYRNLLFCPTASISGRYRLSLDIVGVELQQPVAGTTATRSVW